MITQQQLKSVLRYEPDTGEFYWLASPSPNTPAGSRAGADCEGYRLIRVLGERHRAHRLAWLYVHGEMPVEQVDHKNLIRSDNRIDNLRLATGSQNKSNMRKRSDNTSGYKGVSFYKSTGKWVAQIGCGGVNRRLGYFATPHEAHLAYTRAAQELFGEFARAS